MEDIIIAAATGGDREDDTYMFLRRELMSDHEIRSMLPDFVRTYRSLDAFWPFIKNEASTYAERRQLIRTAFNRLVDYLEDANRTPGDVVTFDTIELLDVEHICSQHSEEPIKAILGGIMNLVNGIGTLRNRLSDSHGRGGRLPVRPSPRHASLAVNAAGAVASFLVETHQEKQK